MDFLCPVALFGFTCGSPSLFRARGFHCITSRRAHVTHVLGCSAPDRSSRSRRRRGRSWSSDDWFGSSDEHLTNKQDGFLDHDGSVQPHPENDDDKLLPHQQAGKMHHWLQRSVNRETRVSVLQRRSAGTPLSSAEEKELEGLMRAGLAYEEQYRPSDFGDSHVEFKAMHNAVFVSLAQYCQSARDERHKLLCEDWHRTTSEDDHGMEEEGDAMQPLESSSSVPINVFYLEGPDGATTSALRNAGFDESRCYVANRHLSTCQVLGATTGINVVHASVSDALRSTKGRRDATHFRHDQGRRHAHANMGAFKDVVFGSYYFDGCGGYVPLIVEMMSAAFDNCCVTVDPGEGLMQSPSTMRRCCPPVAIGFSVVGGNRDVVDKEQEVIRELVAMVKRLGLRVEHVLDDPQRYGIPEGVRKIDGGTMTTWCVLEVDHR